MAHDRRQQMILAWKMQKEGTPGHACALGDAINLQLREALFGNQRFRRLQKPLAGLVTFSCHVIDSGPESPIKQIVSTPKSYHGRDVKRAEDCTFRAIMHLQVHKCSRGEG
jgi:hypothetical protein